MPSHTPNALRASMLAALLALAGCAMTTRPTLQSDPVSAPGIAPQGEEPAAVDAEAAGEDAGASPGAQPRGQVIDALPLLALRPLQPARVPPATQASNDRYTRLYVERRQPAGEARARDYTREVRHPFRRWAVGRTISRVLSLQTSLDRPRITTTYALLASHHASSRGLGEQFGTEQAERRYLTPYFRIDGSGTLSLTAGISATRGFDADAAANVLGLIQAGAGLLSPASALATTINERRISDAAAFVDKALTSTFGQSVTERAVFESRLDRLPLTADSEIAEIEAAFPMGPEIVGTRSERSDVGQWRVVAEAPVATMFGGRVPAGTTGCDPADAIAEARCALRGASPAAVLAFPLDGSTDIRRLLAADPAVSAAMEALLRNASAGNATDRTNAAARVCEGVAAAVTTAGFNRIDSAVIVWAFSHGGQLSSTEGATLRDPATCRPATLARTLGLD